MLRLRSALSLGALSVMLLAPPVSATPPVTGCPSAYVAHSVAEWAELGYPGPTFIDSLGNGDAVVCGLALPEGFTWGWAITANGLSPHSDILYLFRDNDVPAQK